MIPCLNKDALKILVGTADERYNYSPEYFRKTHFPQIMHRYHGNQLIAEVTENELLENLIEIDSGGNRVYLVFGSTGSGKSELLCWIKDRWALQYTDRPVIRISRTELNPQVLIRKCYDALDIPLAINIDENRWELLLKKPITLINQIVWTTLAESLQSDEEIVPVALLVRPIIERNITEFTAQVQKGRITKPLEVLHRYQFDDLMASTTLKMSLEYLSFRQMLSHKLDLFLFEGWDVASLFKQLTAQLKVRGVRPLLLIDDLVQSVNIYATDLLDQLITLEEGNWDVVIGLTPGAVQDSEKGFELTQRIQNLDTINDRVKKLWLSDESGKDFYNLDRSQVVPFMANYLDQLKVSQGFACSKDCHHYNNCFKMTQTSRETERDLLEHEVKLLPFNRHMLMRTFEAIPLGKGKLRYMILNSKEIIRFFLKGKREHVSRVIPLVKREKFADHTDLLVKTFAEWYVPEDHYEGIVPSRILNHFGYSTGDTIVKLHSLGAEITVEQETNEDLFDNLIKEDKMTIRDWVEGKHLNLELLDPVRSGVATLVHDVVKGVNMCRSFTPRTNSMITRKDIIHRTRYPITFDDKGVTFANGININRGYSALQISNFQILRHSDKGRLFQKISNEYETAKWVYQAETLHFVWQDKLEKELSVTIANFVYSLRNWVGIFVKFNDSEWVSNIKTRSPFNQDLVDIAEQCYQDWFMLRDNLFEPIDLNPIPIMDFDQWLESYSPGKELEHYQIGEMSLYVFIVQLKENYRKYRDSLDDSLKQVLHYRMSMLPYLLDSGDKLFHQYATQINIFNEKTVYLLQDYIEFSILESEMKSHHLHDQFAYAESLYKEVNQLIRQFHTLYSDVKLYMADYSQSNLPTSDRIDLSWSNLEEEKERFTILVDELTRLRTCFSMSPRNASLHVIRSSVVSQEVVHVQTTWAQLIECGNKLLKQQPVGQELLHQIAVWQSIDFHELKIRISSISQREADKSNLIKFLRNDLECDEEENDASHILKVIEHNNELRPAIKRQLRLLLEQGYSTLPPIQWRRLLDELKEKFPNLFEVVEIRLVAASNND